ncbi:hypothetical protein KGQ34_02720 [Patescibacteria group bacterium]|nr:hypothetical protein [Patescibacteria group bacterium]
MVDKLGKAILLFGNQNGDHLEGMVIVEGHPGNCVWNLIPIPQNGEKNQEPKQNSGEPPYRRSTIGFRGR